MKHGMLATAISFFALAAGAVAQPRAGYPWQGAAPSPVRGALPLSRGAWPVWPAPLPLPAPAFAVPGWNPPPTAGPAGAGGSASLPTLAPAVIPVSAQLPVETPLGPSAAAEAPLLEEPSFAAVVPGSGSIAIPTAPPRTWGYGDPPPAAAVPPTPLVVSLDYLHWWLQDGPLGIPLVTTGNDAGGAALNEAGTTVLFGNSNMDFQGASGIRLNGKLWFTPEEILGLEASWFMLERRMVPFLGFSDPTGAPQLSRPFLNGGSGNETSLRISFPNELVGAIGISASSRLQGWEVGLRGGAYRSQSLNMDWLFGFRWLDLNEDLRIEEVFQPLIDTPDLFAGRDVAAGATVEVLDRLQGSNHFYGPQMGTRLTGRWGRVLLEGLLKVGVGWTNQVVNIEGSSSLSEVGSPVLTVPGGVLAQVSNIGSYHRNQFTVVPEIGLNLIVELSENVQVQMGYTFIYWSNVVRPGDQIDRVLSDALIPTSQFFGVPPIVGRPLFAFKDDSFWAQGVNFGLTYRY